MNRRKMLRLLGISPALLAGAKAADALTTNGAGHSSKGATGAADSAAGKDTDAARGAAGSQIRITGMNPKGTPPSIQLYPLAPRLSTLDGKTIYLVDTGFQGGDILLQQMQKWFQQNMPTVKTVYKRKAGVYFEDDPALWQEIKAHGNAAIMAIGH